jgi:uncharacterized protein (DUF1501 family)
MSDHDHDAPLDPALQRLAHAAQEGCEESRLLFSRRSMLGVTAGLFSWAFAPQVGHAETGAEEPRLLFVILGGGVDGLNVVPPTRNLDPHYESARGTIALDRNVDTLSLGEAETNFAINKDMPKFREMFIGKEATLVHAIAPPLRVASHFECMYNLESGLPGDKMRSTRTGWLNRLFGVLKRGSNVAGTAGNSAPPKGILISRVNPLILTGPEAVLSWTPGGGAVYKDVNVNQKLIDLYAKKHPPFSTLLKRGVDADRVAGAGNVDTSNSFINNIRSAARVLNQKDGPRIAVVPVGGWDTHENQHTDVRTGIRGRMVDLDNAFDEFKRELRREVWDKTVVVAVTEFGRTVGTNGTRGTDHGEGTVAFLIGGAVNGTGKVKLTDDKWPGLAPEQIPYGRLVANTDTRALFKGVILDHFGAVMRESEYNKLKEDLDNVVFPFSRNVEAMKGLVKTRRV